MSAGRDDLGMGRGEQMASSGQLCMGQREVSGGWIT